MLESSSLTCHAQNDGTLHALIPSILPLATSPTSEYLEHFLGEILTGTSLFIHLTIMYCTPVVLWYTGRHRDELDRYVSALVVLISQSRETEIKQMTQ